MTHTSEEGAKAERCRRIRGMALASTMLASPAEAIKRGEHLMKGKSDG